MNNTLIEITNILDVEKYIDGLKAVIFDMDDTLYSEKEYVRGGYRRIAELFPQLEDAEEQLWHFFSKKQLAIDEFLKCKGFLKDEIKDKCIEVYRFRELDIHLYYGVQEMLERMRERYQLGLISDGRPEGQRAKIKALGVEELFDYMIVTDELGSIEYRKPNELAYKMMARKFGAEYSEMCYVGDNMKKDFIAPMKLGMRSIWFRNPDGLYI